MTMGQIYSSQSGTGTDLQWTECHCDRFIEERVVLGQIHI